MVAAATPSTASSIAAYFPLTFPVPTPISHPHLIRAADLTAEEDLLHNPENLRPWLMHIQNIKDRVASTLPSRSEAAADTSAKAKLLGPLNTQAARDGLQEITSIYERALAIFPTNFKLWKGYHLTRQTYVLGFPTAAAQKARKLAFRRGALYKTNVAELLDAAETEHEWEGGLDGVIGYEEWKSLIATGERMIGWQSTLPVPWLMHLGVLLHPKCPAPFRRTYARRTFDRALRTLPASLHGRIWGLYLHWAEVIGGEAGARVWRRYLDIDPALTERHIKYLLDSKPARPLAAAKYLLSLARKATAGTYIPLEGKSPYQLFVDFLELAEQYSEEIGLTEDEAEELKAQAEATPAEAAAKPEAASVNGKLIRIPGKDEAAEASVPAAKKISPEEDPADPSRIDVEAVVAKDGLAVYKDQGGRLWTGLATYWIKRGEFDRAQATFERGISSVVTIRDFTQIFDAYTEYSETMISSLMEAIQDDDGEDEDFDAAETEQELDERMQAFEQLMDRRPFLVNDVLLRRNPNEVTEWEKRVALHAGDDEKIVETYNRALETIAPKKATAPLYPVYVNFAKFYEQGGSVDPETQEPGNEPDLPAARQIFEKATRVNYKTVDELAEVWCEWAEMELRNENYDEAVRLMLRATAVPKVTKVDFYNDAIPPQGRLFKSLKLWSFYCDLEESIGTMESTKAVYDKILELKIANAQTIVNYATFLEENKYFEESFKVYERGIELFNFPVAFEIWNIYLSKFVKRYGGKKLERARDLFEQALENCPPKHCKPLYLMYAQLEEEHGLAKRAMGIYDRAATTVQDADKFDMYTIYIAKATANFGLPATRPIYERALETLPDRETAEMCRRFAALERKLGEIDRARAIYAHASQFCDPRSHADFWQEWNQFEIDTGSEDTFREMLRIKRAVQSAFNTEQSFIAAQANAARTGGVKPTAEAAEAAGVAADPMAAMERDLARSNAPAFVSSTQKPANAAPEETDGVPVANPDAITIDDDEL